MPKSFRLAAPLALLTVGTQVAAQSTIVPDQIGAPFRRIQVGIVIPLGSGGSRAERTPRLETWSEPVDSHRDQDVLIRSDYREIVTLPRIGITLDRQSQLMINGHAAVQGKDRRDISGLGIAGIVVGVAVVAAAVFVIEYKTSGLGD